MMHTLEEIARYLGRESSERPGPDIDGVRPLEYARARDITYIVGERFVNEFEKSLAAAVIVPPGLEPSDRPYILSTNPEADFARLTKLFYAQRAAPEGVSKKADVHPEALLGSDVSVGPFAVIGRAAVLGKGATIGAHVVIGEEVEIGEDATVFPNVVIYPGVRIGRRVIVHSGAVIGADGFGFARDADEYGLPLAVKKYHSGTVEIEDDVEIGALCAVDRALSGSTRIGKGAKLDNLVQVAHNVQIGPGTVIAGQAGIAGSSSVGAYCMIGGQAGIRDHVHVGSGVILATRTGIWRNVPDGSIMAGSIPAMPLNVFRRAQSLFKRLPEMLDRIKNLERLMQNKDREGR
jgi:UDP-3-O-[3-hydroxymyristoyl] glucosamine N-acyltransferase